MLTSSKREEREPTNSRNPGGFPASLGSVHWGWTVFQIPSTPVSFSAVGSITCGPDRADRGRLGRRCQLVRQLRPRGSWMTPTSWRKQEAQVRHTSGGWCTTPAGSPAEYAGNFVAAPLGVGEQPSRLARSGLWGR